jgi:hypothetical protein
VSDTCLTRSRLSDVRLSTQHHTAVGAVEPPLTLNQDRAKPTRAKQLLRNRTGTGVRAAGARSPSLAIGIYERSPFIVGNPEEDARVRFFSV